MERKYRIKYFFIFFIVVIVALLLVCHMRHPMIYTGDHNQEWSVASGIINEGETVTPQTIISFEMMDSLTPTEFIADPFFVLKDSAFYLFVEHKIGDKGVISYFNSSDFKSWLFGGVVIDEPFHMSYPQVFEWGGKYYMIPETTRSDNVLLYEALSFPTQWAVVDTLMEGRIKDPTLLHQDGYLYIFGVDEKNVHRVFVSENLNSGWKEHIQSPIGVGNFKRPAGSVINQKGKMFLPVQGTRFGYGSEVYLREIETISPDEIKLRDESVLMISNFEDVKYFQDGVHHIDIKKIDSRLYYVIDGRGSLSEKTTFFSIRSSITKNILDVFDALGWYELPDIFY